MKIAVIGAGISGLGSAWLLAGQHDVHLFEADSRLGGHAHTVAVEEQTNEAPAVNADIGFLVYNELTYPHLSAFFRALQVETVDSSMSLSIQSKDTGLEWAGNDFNSIFGQRSNLLRPKFYAMLFEILRFGREAHESLHLSRRHAWSLSDLLSIKKYSQSFVLDYLLPIGAAIWSTPEIKMLQFPAATFLTFFINHRLLQVNDRPVWKTVKNGSIQYVERAAKKIPHIHLSTPVLEVERISSGKVRVKTKGATQDFDRVVMATHAPITAKILKFQSDLEKDVLTSVPYEDNRAILHNDEGLMPQSKRCWSSWNVFAKKNQQSQQVSLSYYLNLLQPLKTARNHFLTLNPMGDVKGEFREFHYAHPQFDQKAISAQKDLPSIQGKGGVYFAGAWSRYGFHEDGLLSGVNVAKLMGIDTPWKAS